MLHLVICGSASGKSAFGEKIANEYYEKIKKIQINEKCESKMFYVATMMSKDEESLARIKKHQEMRKEKSFDTIECFYDIGVSLQKDDYMSCHNVFLLECMSNLLANEMYGKDGNIKGSSFEVLRKKTSQYIINPIQKLAKSQDVIVISNEIFSEGKSSFEETETYIKILGYINESLLRIADYGTEVVCSIPVSLK